MRIGPHALDNPVALAPMAGVTDLPFRRLCKTLGAGYVVGEMLASDPSLRNTRKSRLRGVHLEEPAPRAIQIVGWDPDAMAAAAAFNAAQGASIIDINMGCPAKKVCQRYAGSALLDQEDQVKRILDAVVRAVEVPVTLKIRTGVSPENRNGVAIARIAEQAGIAALAVHGRTRSCRYKGQAEFETVADICRAVHIPVFANGDITSHEQAVSILSQTGASGIMVGRGAHGAPWFPGQLASYIETGKKPDDPAPQTKLQIILEHLEAMHSFYGNEQGVRIARKHIKWYFAKFNNAKIADPDMFRTNNPDQQAKMVREHGHRCIGEYMAPGTERQSSVSRTKGSQSLLPARQVVISRKGKCLESGSRRQGL